MASALTAREAVQARIAQALLPRDAAARLGAFTLRGGQRETVAAIRAALAAHGGALVADAPGTGKTIIALAVAADYPDVLAIVPAAVRAQWQQAAARAGISLRLVTLEALSRGAQPPAAPLVIVDEAHHLRTPGTRRYRALADLAAGRHVLLLSATPVVNRGRDRDALLALFLGSVDAHDPDVVARVVLRRATAPSAGVAVRRLPPLQSAADVPGLASALLALPPPFPSRDGQAATALIRITLAMAWSSSLHALDASLRRRIQRGGVLLEELRAGRWPTRDALRAWLYGDDATQLALPLALPDAAAPPADAATLLARHLAAVSALRADIAPHVTRDLTARATALRQLFAREGTRRIVLLAHHTETVRALYGALRHEPGVVAVVGTRVHAAAGRWSREDVLAALGPERPPWSPHDIRGIRLLLATDILAEGVELQGCATLVHGDLTWTPARLEQRVGRLVRDGQRQRVHVTRFAVPSEARRLLQIARRLHAKRRARTTALAPADGEADRSAMLRRWARDAVPMEAPRIAAAHAPCCGFLALAHRGTEPILLTATYDGGRWRITRNLGAAVQLAGRVDGDATLDGAMVHTARRLIRRWWHREQTRASVQGETRRLPVQLLRRASRALDAWLSTQTLAQREPGAARVASLRKGLARLRGIGAERAMAAALALGDATATLQALQRCVDGSVREPTAPTDLRLSALLILRPTPAAPDRPSASTGSAAPR